ncbi:acyl-CoA N-acyltransferase [Fomitopsis serialis]|uniref:acyl-CoA N-acyltransferase n=1 Tax=Fomitopsis serialis TaxID=139415 RepID=UPI0020076073|nr:acyl-CoA N-acyltransferase [Neoantrodia serialis]KAH9922667.1 acyl-CoA N-acyltransferase [Neoantrodia serialis]
MLGDPKVRARCLRALTLLPRPHRPAAVPIFDHLAEVIRHATGLRRIVLDYADDSFLDSCPTLADALADVESLETIRFDFVSTRGVALLSRMKSQPRSVQCSVNVFRLPSQGPTRFLHNFVQSLTFLELYDALDILAVDTESHAVWPRVRKLVLQDEKIRREHWQFICRAFPNLRTLRMGGMLLDTAGTCAEWSEMDLVQTRSPLPLRCHVRCVELNISLDKQFLSPHNVADYLEMLGHSSPVALTCHLNDRILDYLPVRLPRLRFLHLATHDLELPTELGGVARWVDATLLRLASCLAQTQVRTVIVDLPHKCTNRRAELRSHAENIATHARFGMSFTNLYQPPQPPPAPTESELYGADPYDINYVFPLDLQLLQNDRVRLTPFVPRAHGALLWDAVGPTFPDLFRYYPILFTTLEQNLAFFERAYRSNPECVLFAILDKATPDDSHPELGGGSFAGLIGLIRTSRAQLTTEIGYAVIFPEFQRKKIASNATAILLKYCLELPTASPPGLGLRRVQWGAHSDNVASIRVATKLGFKMEGTHRWAYIRKDRMGHTPRKGDPCPGQGGFDIAILSMCCDDWEAGGRELTQMCIDEHRI